MWQSFFENLVAISFYSSNNVNNDICTFQGYSRLGAALTYLNRYSKAKEAYETGLTHDPNNDQLKTGLEDVKSRISSSSANAPQGNYYD